MAPLLCSLSPWPVADERGSGRKHPDVPWLNRVHTHMAILCLAPACKPYEAVDAV